MSKEWLEYEDIKSFYDAAKLLDKNRKPFLLKFAMLIETKNMSYAKLAVISKALRLCEESQMHDGYKPNSVFIPKFRNLYDGEYEKTQNISKLESYQYTDENGNVNRYACCDNDNIPISDLDPKELIFTYNLSTTIYLGRKFIELFYKHYIKNK